ncbi:MAG TPA: AI-2E family transporter [Candidatus Limnocylindrales bacterium]|nr:AI-2E family transporter [Candidatus Limnocylindrales bacterium]
MRPLWASPAACLVAAALVVLWLGRDVLGPFVVAGVLAYAFSPIVSAAVDRTGWPRIAIVAIGYATTIVLLAIVVALIGRPAADEVRSVASSGPDAIANGLRDLIGADSIEVAGEAITVAVVARALQTQLGSLFASPGDAVHLAAGIGSFVLDTILVLIVTFYLLLDGPRFLDAALRRVPADRRARTAEILARVHATLGRWLRGQLFLIALVAVVIYVVLGPILHLPYALGISILTGVLEIIPIVGPLVAATIAVVDALAHGGVSVAVVVAVVYFVVRQVEDQIVMPVVIGRVVHLHPVVTIFAVLVGLSAFGILGGLLGVPVAAAANVVFNEVFPPPAEPPAIGRPAADEAAPAGAEVDP